MARRVHDCNVFFIALMDKHITVKQVLRFIEDEMVENLKTDPRGQEFITWGEIETYFRTLRKVSDADKEKLVMRLNEDTDKEYHLEIDREYLQLLKDVFDTVPRVLDGRLA